MTFQHVWDVLTTGIERNAFPGAVAAIADEEGIVARWHGGHAALEPQRVPMHGDMIFDVASLTKVVATLPAILRLVETGLLSLDEPIATYIRAWHGPGKDNVTVRHLLTHTGGLSAWYPTYARPAGDEAESPDRTTAIDVITGLDLAYQPGAKVQYSCLGYILLGHIVELITGQRLDRFVAEHVFAPLGMTDTAYRPLAGNVVRDRDAGDIGDGIAEAHAAEDLAQRIVATERDNTHERGTVAELGLTFSGWRDGVTVGEVHDGNARYGLHGVSGNAGVFATADDLVRYGQSWLRALRGESTWLSQATAQLAIIDHTPGLDTSRGLGWLLLPTDAAVRSTGPMPSGPRSCGELLSPGSFGHTGFTGTTLWVDPDRSLVFVLLTNRVHPHTRTGLDIVRARFHNAAVATVTRSGGKSDGVSGHVSGDGSGGKSNGGSGGKSDGGSGDSSGRKSDGVSGGVSDDSSSGRSRSNDLRAKDGDSH